MNDLLLEIKNDGLYSFVRKNVHDNEVKEIILTILDVATSNLTDEEYEAFKNQVIKEVIKD